MQEENLRHEIERLAARLDRIEHRLGISAGPDASPAAKATSPSKSAVPVSSPNPTISSAAAPPLDLDLDRDEAVLAAPGDAEPTQSAVPDTVDIDVPLPAAAPVRGIPPLTPFTSRGGAPAPPIAPPTQPTAPPVSAPLSTGDTRAAALTRLQDDWLARPPVVKTTPPLRPLTASASHTPQLTAPRPKGSASWEQIIGGKWMAWVGAMAVLVAVAFAIAIGVDRGWWSNTPPILRCLGIGGFGALLMIGGEIALRRIGKAASVGLFGAGLGTLYLDAFATFGQFDLLSKEWAFILMAVVAVGGFAITYRTRFFTIGVLSIVGGYLTPVLLRGQSGHDLELLGYLTMLLGISLGLSAFVPRNFRALRYVAFGCHVAMALGWLLIKGPDLRIMALVFMSMWWSMTLAEAVFAAMRRQSGIGNVVMSLTSTAAFVTAGCWLLGTVPPMTFDWSAAFCGMIAVLAAATALQFGPGIDVLRSTPKHAMDKLAVALWAQAGVLLATANALQFEGFGQSIGWLAIAAASIEVARRLPSRGVAVFGLVVGALALGRVLTLDWWIGSDMNQTLWELADLRINRWSILMLIAILVTHACAHRLRSQPPAGWRAMPVVLAVIASAYWMILCAAQCDHLVMTGAWLLGAVVMLGLERFGRRQRYFEIGMLMLLATAGKWLIFDAIAARVASSWNAVDSLPVLNWQMGLAALIAAAGWWTYRIMRSRAASDDGSEPSGGSLSTGWQVALIVGTIFTLMALSFEADHFVRRIATRGATSSWSTGHLRQLLLTMLWAFGSTGIGLLATSLMRQSQRILSPPRLLVRFAWSVLTLCALKWLIGDTLLFSLLDPPRLLTAPLAVLNLQLLAGIAVAGAGLTLWHAQPPEARSESRLDVSGWVPVAVAIMVLWGLSFEVDRALAHITSPSRWISVWTDDHLRALLWTGLWAIGAAAMMLIGRWRNIQPLVQSGIVIVLGAAVAWLTYDTLTRRLMDGAVDTTIILNPQFLVGALIAGMLLVASRMGRQPEDADGSIDLALRSSEARPLIVCAGVLIAAIGLWLGSMEIDRFFIGQPKSVQTGLSVYWGVYAVILVAIGFWKRATACRYAGLGLLCLMTLKVLIVDLSEAGQVARMLSVLIAGLLMIGTSVAYARLSPILLRKSEDG